MKRSLLISFLFLVIMIVVLRWQESALITPQSPRGIIDLEFAKSPDRLLPLRFFWDPETVLRHIYLNFLFTFIYAWFFVTACKAVRNRKSNLFSGIVVSAAAFDILGNFLMMLVWNGRFSPSVLQVVFYVSLIKVLLIVTVIGYLILSLFGLFKRESAD